jgi:enoyl-CoA hydratase/carnithine racemase
MDPEVVMIEAGKTYQNIILERDGTIAVVTMNRPEKRNALSVAHMEDLIDCFQAIKADPGISVVILRGAGPVFSSGHDLGEMADKPKEFFDHEFAVCSRLMELIVALPQPVIAEVHGIATAAGCQLVATCDLAIAAEEAQFATPGVKNGLFCTTPMVALSRAVGKKGAMEMLLTGDFIPAREAMALGLVNRVVPAGDLRETTLALAEKIVAASSPVVGIGKQAFYRQIDMPLHEAYEYASEVMSENAVMEDAQEGMHAFLEKRPPEWKGK